MFLRIASTLSLLALLCSCHGWQGIPVSELRNTYSFNNNISFEEIRQAFILSMEAKGFTVNNAASSQPDAIISEWKIETIRNRVRKEKVQFYFSKRVDNGTTCVRGDVFVQEKYYRDSDQAYRDVRLTRSQEIEIAEPIISSAIMRLQ